MSRPRVKDTTYSPYLTFPRREWAELRDNTPLTLSEADLAPLRGLNERLDLDEVVDIYLPLSRLLNLYVAATQGLYQATDTFLGHHSNRVPFIIGIAGSVAVGKSTTARILRELLSHWLNHPDVDLVTTDGFLYPNRTLEDRRIMNRKGFPESYDVRALIGFLAAVKSGQPEVAAPVYSHLRYDIQPGEAKVVRSPDILIVEGLNILQTNHGRTADQVFVSDFLDFSIYVDADEDLILHWYAERFLRLRDSAFRQPESYFHRYAALTDTEAREVAVGIWNDINGPNLRANILPTRDRATLVLEKGDQHAVRRIRLRKR
ncbi:MAG: type I pantothenate kinase [Clostridia bacterium]